MRKLFLGIIVCVACVGLSLANSKEPKPAESKLTIPSGPLGDTIRLGQELVENTAGHPLTKPYVGNALHCTSCHLENGQDPHAASFLGVATAYPAWSARERRVITLEDRVLNCFMRSCNGIRPPLGSPPSIAITAYITWLSTGEPIRMNAQQPKGPRAVRPISQSVTLADLEQGRQVFAKRCADCHANDGAGRDDNPPVWGNQSYNSGAGFAHSEQLAAWVKVSMPLDDATLTDQEAFDVAAFINSHARPQFILKEHLPDPSQLGVYNSEPEIER